MLKYNDIKVETIRRYHERTRVENQVEVSQMDEILNEYEPVVENEQKVNDGDTVITKTVEIIPENIQLQNVQSVTDQSQSGQLQFNNQQIAKPQYDQASYNQQQITQPQYNQPQNNQPQYNQQQYNQPQYNQPQYNQPQYNQPPYNQPQYNQTSFAQVPYGQMQNNQAPYMQPGQMGRQVPFFSQTPGVAHEEHIGMAVGAIACSIASLVLCSLWFISILLAAAGIVMGVICLRNQSDGKEMAIAAVIAGSIGAIVSFISCIFWMVAIFG